MAIKSSPRDRSSHARIRQPLHRRIFRRRLRSGRRHMDSDRRSDRYPAKCRTYRKEKKEKMIFLSYMKIYSRKLLSFKNAKSSHSTDRKIILLTFQWRQ